jgi:four helix bundle protein
MPQSQFDHENLKVYQKAIAFVGYADDILKGLPKSLAVHGQLDRAATSIPLNIAEGNGKFTPADRCRYFDIARGSALESAACLDVLIANKNIEASAATKGKEEWRKVSVASRQCGTGVSPVFTGGTPVSPCCWSGLFVQTLIREMFDDENDSDASCDRDYDYDEE